MSFKVREAHWQILLEAMEANSVLATGKFVGPKGRDIYKKLWDETATKLNALGFGSKSTDKWQKTWSDFKYHLKRKAANLTKSMGKTGGGTSEDKELSSLELRMLDILGEHFIGLDESECGLPIPLQTLEREEPQPSTSKQMECDVAGPSSEYVQEHSTTKRKLNIHEPASKKKPSVEYLPEYRETLDELKNIKTTLKDSLQSISQDLKDLTAEIKLLNNNLVQILQQQQRFNENLYSV